MFILSTFTLHLFESPLIDSPIHVYLSFVLFVDVPNTFFFGGLFDLV